MVGELASLGGGGVINILQVRANRDLVLFVVLVDHELVSAHRGERYLILLVEAPPVEALAQLLRVKLLRLHLYLRIWVFIVFIDRR